MTSIRANHYDWSPHQMADEDRVSEQNHVRASKQHLKSGISVLIPKSWTPINSSLQAKGMPLENARAFVNVDIPGFQEPSAVERTLVLKVNLDVEVQCSKLFACEACLRHF